MATSGEPFDARLLPIRLEEYKQILKERHFVMTRYMQAVGLYLLLSSYVLTQLLKDNIPRQQLWLLGTAFSVLNVAAFFAAGKFREMARHARDREVAIARLLSVGMTPELYWGHRLGIVLVSTMQLAAISTVVCALVFGNQAPVPGHNAEPAKRESIPERKTPATQGQ